MLGPGYLIRLNRTTQYHHDAGSASSKKDIRRTDPTKRGSPNSELTPHEAQTRYGDNRAEIGDITEFSPYATRMVSKR